MSEEEKIDKTPVAQDIWCYSPKEKAFTWHVVVNHNADGYVDRVQCKVTGQIHKYKKLSATAKTKRKVTSKVKSTRSVSKSADALADVWFTGIKNWGEKEIETYAPQNAYEEKDVFSHAVFGKGIVQKKRGNKIDVLFRQGMKVLPTK